MTVYLWVCVCGHSCICLSVCHCFCSSKNVCLFVREPTSVSHCLPFLCVSMFEDVCLSMLSDCVNVCISVLFYVLVSVCLCESAWLYVFVSLCVALLVFLCMNM